ncbi:MAG: hypothetical protein Q4E62_05735 [Sutterellaceae bacterium]|nr:hypothetical protein [Sutterellaceae bacterium]
MAKHKFSKTPKLSLSDSKQVCLLLFSTALTAAAESLALLRKLPPPESLSGSDLAEVEAYLARTNETIAVRALVSLYEIFSGQARDRVVYRDWDALAFESRMRKEFAFQLQCLSESERAAINEPKGIIRFAVGAFLSETSKQLLGSVATSADGFFDLKKLAESSICWTQRLLGKQMTEEEKKQIFAFAKKSER